MIAGVLEFLALALFHGSSHVLSDSGDIKMTDKPDEEPIDYPNTVEEMQAWLRGQADHFSNDGYYEEAIIAQHIAMRIGQMGKPMDTDDQARS